MKHYWATIVGIGLGTVVPAIRAADTEVRVFSVKVDGKSAGEFQLTIHSGDDGSENATAIASVVVKHLLGTYRYSLHCAESWSGGRLKNLDSYSNDDGEKHYVRATASEAAIHVSVDGRRSFDVKSPMWPTTFWRQPDFVPADQAWVVLNVDTGESPATTFDRQNATSMQLSGKAIEATHYRIRGAVQADLWFDGRGRLVREEMTEDGHNTVLELREIRH
jgi:hypothetical protein